MSRPAARKAAPKGEYIETVSDMLPMNILIVLRRFDTISVKVILGLVSFHVRRRSSVPELVVFLQLNVYHDSHLVLPGASKGHLHNINAPLLTPPQDSGNKVSRRAAITGTANITLGGRTVIMADVQLRGDLKPTRPMPSQSGKETTPISINIGRCTVISTGSVIKPPSRISRGQVHYYPMKIGDNVFVGQCLATS